MNAVRCLCRSLLVAGVLVIPWAAEGQTAAFPHPGALDLAFGAGSGPGGLSFDSAVYCLAVQADGKIVDGFPVRHIARLFGGPPRPPLPVIVQQPVDAVATEGRPASLSVTATGTPPLSYQWQKNGLLLPAETNHLLHRASVQLLDAGTYAVRVSGEGGSVWSASARLTVLPEGTPAEQDQSVPAVASDGADFFVVWLDRRSYGSGGWTECDVYGARVTAEGTVLDPGGLLIGRHSYMHNRPAVGFDGTNYLVAWAYNPGGTLTDIYATRLSPAGQVLETNEILLSSMVRLAPVVTWEAPEVTVYGTPLSSYELNATADVAGSFRYEPPAGTVLEAGAYDLSVLFTPEDTHAYAPVVATTSLTVQPAPLTVQANDQTRIQGQPNPPFTATYTGFVNGDTPASLDTPAVLTTSATPESPPGVYPIVVSRVSDANYAITFRDGLLEVFPDRPGPGSFDPSFDPGAGIGGSVYAAALQADGRIVVGGDFTEVNGVPRAHLARLNAEGSLDLAFNPNLGWVLAIYAVLLQPDGRVLVSGAFADRPTQDSLSRVNPDGTVDATFQFRAGVYGRLDTGIGSLALQPDGRILIAGDFARVGNLSCNMVARLLPDGAMDPTFNSGTNAPGEYYLTSLVLQPDGKVVVGGRFHQFHGVARNSVARLNPDGSLDDTFVPDLPEGTRVTSLARLADGSFLVGCQPQGAPPNPNEALVRLFPNGLRDRGYRASVEGTVTALVPQPDGRVVIGGWVETVGGLSRHGIARLYADGSLDPSFDPGTGFYAAAVHVLVPQPDGNLVAGGSFESYDGIPSRSIARLRGDTGVRPPGSLDLTFDPTAGTHAIATNLVAAHAAALQPDGRILMGGALSDSTFHYRSVLARLQSTGAVDDTFEALLGFGGSVLDLAAQPDGKVLLAGTFREILGTRRNGLARLMPDGSLDRTFDPQEALASGFTGPFALQPDGRIVVSVSSDDFLRTTGGRTSWGILRLNADGSEDPGFLRTPLDTAESPDIELQPDGRILVAGSIAAVHGVPRLGLARLQPDGRLDAGFVPFADVETKSVVQWISAVAVMADGRIVVAGHFELHRAGWTWHSLARLNRDGHLDPSFRCGVLAVLDPDDGVADLAIQADGKILAGGHFNDTPGVPIRPMFRLHSNGELDSTFHVSLTGYATGEPGSVWSILLQPDGQVLIVGGFTAVDGVARPGIARLHNDLTEPFVRRDIAEAGRITLVASPAARVHVYAVEEQPPPGWPVSDISHDGVFDAATGKVKFGPFYDHEPRALTYRVLSPVWGVHCALGVFCFEGLASADGVNSTIAGDACLALAGYFPADQNPADRRMSIGEVTAYGAAWRRGAGWECHAQEIPIDYVTRAAALWRAGECYTVDSRITREPLWWVPCPDPASPSPGPARAALPAAGGVADRLTPAAFVPGEAVTVRIAVQPAAEGTAYAVEEMVPAGWTVAGLSDTGEVDAVHGTVKWGPFLDSRPRLVSYQATPPREATGTARLMGVVSFDGVSVPISGHGQVEASCRLACLPPLGPRPCTLRLHGELARSYAIEASPDLVQWTPLTTVTNQTGHLEIRDPAGEGFAQRFYRARRLP